MATAFDQRIAELQKISSVSTATATTAAATNIITTTGHDYVNGDIVQFATDDTLPDPLAAGTNYFVRDVSSDTYKVAATRGGAEVDITDTGTGNHTSWKVASTSAATHSAVSLVKDGYLEYYPDGAKVSIRPTLNGSKYLAMFKSRGYVS